MPEELPGPLGELAKGEASPRPTGGDSELDPRRRRSAIRGVDDEVHAAVVDRDRPSRPRIGLAPEGPGNIEELVGVMLVESPDRVVTTVGRPPPAHQ